MMNRLAVALTSVLTLVACERICVETHRAILDGYLDGYDILMNERPLEEDPRDWVDRVEQSQYRLEECTKECRNRGG